MRKWILLTLVVLLVVSTCGPAVAEITPLIEPIDCYFTPEYQAVYPSSGYKAIWDGHWGGGAGAPYTINVDFNDGTTDQFGTWGYAIYGYSHHMELPHFHGVVYNVRFRVSSALVAYDYCQVETRWW